MSIPNNTLNNPARFDQQAADMFLRSWQLYRKVIHHDYMFHREITAAVATYLGGYNPAQPLTLLDLGCGDASMALPLMPASRFAGYIGCDLSEPALTVAREQLAANLIPCQLLNEDMHTTISNLTEASVDVVFSSFAMHHLAPGSKEEIVRQAYRVLKPGGRFILVDVFRDGQENRDETLTRYNHEIAQKWKALSEAEVAIIIDHSSHFDYPESAVFYERCATSAGFSSAENLCKLTWHEVWSFAKCQSA
jgi:ubiquinone/menaquinone biosynthesis C-methylase UbiE